MQIPSYNELVKTIEKALTETLNGEAILKTYTINTEELLDEIIEIDTAKFRESLRYSREELTERFNSPGFTCIVLYLDEAPIAFDYGYNHTMKGTYFSDSSATLIERRRIGGYLGLLELVYLYENEYEALYFTTEEMDESGRPLRQIWENMGYRTVSVSPDGGVNMMLEINKEVVLRQIKKMLPDYAL